MPKIIVRNLSLSSLVVNGLLGCVASNPKSPLLIPAPDEDGKTLPITIDQPKGIHPELLQLQHAKLIDIEVISTQESRPNPAAQSAQRTWDALGNLIKTTEPIAPVAPGAPVAPVAPAPVAVAPTPAPVQPKAKSKVKAKAKAKTSKKSVAQKPVEAKSYVSLGNGKTKKVKMVPSLVDAAAAKLPPTSPARQALEDPNPIIDTNPANEPKKEDEYSGAFIDIHTSRPIAVPPSNKPKA